MTILACNREHIPEVVELLAGRTAQEDPADHAERCRYFEDVFFSNPWHDPDLPSLVYQDETGRVDGFLGVLPKPMVFEGEPVRAALACKLRVRNPAEGQGPRNPWTALRLLKRFFKGPQDLSVANPVNLDGKKIFEACGGLAVPLYSLRWFRPIRPARAVLAFMEVQSNRRSRPLTLLADAADLAGTRIVSRLAASRGEPYALAGLDARSAVEALERAPGFDLRPHYDAPSLEWVLEMARRRAMGGCFRAAMVKDNARRDIGWFVYVQVREHVGLVLQSIAVDGHHGTVLRAAIEDAADRGLALLWGAVSGGDLQPYNVNRCPLQGGDEWMFTHSRQPPLVEAFLRGRALFTGLDSERWIRRDRS
jgi:hypothetical protein